MIYPSDEIERSVWVIFNMWEQGGCKFTLPKIPTTLPVKDLRGYLNRWLFESGLLDSVVYREQYHHAPSKIRCPWKDMLDTIFCEDDVK